MYYCPECKKLVFEKTMTIEEKHYELTEFGYTPSEYFDIEICSECGSGDITTASEDVLGRECCPSDEYSEEKEEYFTQIIGKVMQECEECNIYG